MNILTSLPTKAAYRAEAQRVAPATEGEAVAPSPMDSLSVGEEQPEKEWTVLVWANGKANGADRLAPSVLRELEVAGSDDRMDIVAQLGRKERIYDKVTKDWSGVRRYHVERNPDPPPLQKEIVKWFLPPYTDGIVSPVLEDLGKADMGSSASLSEFLQWGMKEYPAKNYAVVIYGEAGGIAGAAIDEESGHRLTAPGIEQAFREATIATGRKVDLVAFDGSYMAGLEVAHQLKDVADVMVGSQAAVKLGSIQFDMVMKNLKFELAEKGSVTPEELAKWFVFETMAQPGPMAAMVNPTLSAVDLKKIDGVKEAYGTLAEALSGELEGNPSAREAVRQTIGETQNYATNEKLSDFYGDYRDLGHFAKNLASDARLGEEVRAAANAVLAATKASLIDETHHGEEFKNSHGLSAYLPLDAGYDLHSGWKAPRGFDPLHGYSDHSVAQQTEWGSLLNGIAEEEAFPARLRKLGLGNAGIVRTEKTLGALKSVGKMALAFTSRIGSWQAWSHARGKDPGRYFGIPPSVGTPLSVVGGARDAFLGGRQVVGAALDKGLVNKRQAVVDGALDTVSGLGVTVAAVGHMVEDAAFLKRPAAIVAVGTPFVKMAHGALSTRSRMVAAKQEAIASSPEERLSRLADARNQHYYVSPVARLLVDLGSTGSLDMNRAKA